MASTDPSPPTGSSSDPPADPPADSSPISSVFSSPLAAHRGGRGDAIFSALAKSSGIFVLLLIGAIGVFLAGKAIPAYRLQGIHFLTEKEWFPDSTPPVFGIAALVFG